MHGNDDAEGQGKGEGGSKHTEYRRQDIGERRVIGARRWERQEMAGNRRWAMGDGPEEDRRRQRAKGASYVLL